VELLLRAKSTPFCRPSQDDPGFPETLGLTIIAWHYTLYSKVSCNEGKKRHRRFGKKPVR
jgi:hypothetical protein